MRVPQSRHLGKVDKSQRWLCAGTILDRHSRSPELESSWVREGWAAHQVVVSAKGQVARGWGFTLSGVGGEPLAAGEDEDSGLGCLGRSFRLPLRTMQFHSDHQVAELSMASSSGLSQVGRGSLLGLGVPESHRAPHRSLPPARDPPALRCTWQADVNQLGVSTLGEGSTLSGALFLYLSPGLAPPGPLAWQSPPSMAFSELPAHGPHVSWAQATLGDLSGDCALAGRLLWWDQGQALAHSRCSVCIAK